MPGPKIKCANCKDIIQSKHRHDFIWCDCGSIAIDGGGEYTRIIGDNQNIIELDNIKSQVNNNKIKLYQSLIEKLDNLGEDDVSENEAELMYLLSQDKDIQQKFS